MLEYLNEIKFLWLHYKSEGLEGFGAIQNKGKK